MSRRGTVSVSAESFANKVGCAILRKHVTFLRFAVPASQAVTVQYTNTVDAIVLKPTIALTT